MKIRSESNPHRQAGDPYPPHSEPWKSMYLVVAQAIEFVLYRTLVVFFCLFMVPWNIAKAIFDSKNNRHPISEGVDSAREVSKTICDLVVYILY